MKRYDVLIGRQVVIATLDHDLTPEKRANMLPAPVTIGNGVWIGAYAKSRIDRVVIGFDN